MLLKDRYTLLPIQCVCVDAIAEIEVHRRVVEVQYILAVYCFVMWMLLLTENLIC